MPRNKPDLRLFPKELRNREDGFIRHRRLGTTAPAGDEKVKNTVGLALSGGGIRSATTSLGILQALAELHILKFVDYLSTVSGGGYMGTCMGMLYHRWPGDPAAARAVQANAP